MYNVLKELQEYDGISTSIYRNVQEIKTKVYKFMKLYNRINELTHYR